MKNYAHARYRVALNPSYWNSAYAALRLVVICGPYTLFHSLKPAFMSLFALIGVFIAALARWSGLQLMYLFYGLAGYLVVEDDDESEET